jgi:hypothetical protein
LGDDSFLSYTISQEDTVKKTLVICLALLVLVSISALAEDNSSKTITINGGSTTVFMGKATGVRKANKAACVGFYDNICGSGYQSGIGWTVSDGSPVNFEWSPASQITASKSGKTKKITVGLGYVEGTNSTLIDLVKDCKNVPCTTPDASPKKDVLCHGTVKNMPTFGSTGTTTVSFACHARLTKGKASWVLMQSPANSWLAWNESNSATAPLYSGENDSWVSRGTLSIGALTVQ